MSQWRIHACFLDRDCRKYGSGNRIQVITPYGSLYLAPTWADRTQLWLPFRGYTKWWSPIAWHPQRRGER